MGEMIGLRTGLAVCAAVASMWCMPAPCEGQQRVFGTLVKPPSANSIAVETSQGSKSFAVTTSAKVRRGQVGFDAKTAKLSDLRPGDYLTITVAEGGNLTDIVASFGMVKGKLSAVQNGSIVLADGRKVSSRKDVQVILPDGGLGSLDRLVSGWELTCRVSPATNEAWSVVASPIAASTSSPAAASSPTTVVPKINSLIYKPESGITPGTILLVEMQGTPGGKASFDIKGLLSATVLNESTPGHYAAEIKLPADKIVTNAPLVGYLAVGSVKAPAVQAGKLISLVRAVPQPVVASVALPEEPATPVATAAVTPQIVSVPITTGKQATHAVVPVKAVSTAAPVPGKPEELRQIVIKTPEDGGKIRSAIVVTGQASPDSRVGVIITYNNGRVGLLKLAGQVISQTLAVGKDGHFKLGPIPLEGPLATKGLRFTIKAYYPDRENHGTAIVTAIGDRL